MQIPSVSGLFQSRVGSVMNRAPVGLQPGTGSFAGQLAQAVAGSGRQGGGAIQELTIVANPAASAAPLLTADQIIQTRSVTPAGTARVAPQYIPAAALTPVSAPAGNPAMAQKVVDFAKQFVGTPYVAGGEDLVKGADCSGFVQSVFAHFGIKLPRSSYRQSMVGTEVDVKDLRPGDLLFFKTDDYAPVTHVAMYIGDGKIIHAASKKTGVIISKLKIKDDFVIARRLIP